MFQEGVIYNFSISSIDEVYGNIIEIKKFSDFVHLKEDNVFHRINTFSKNKHGLYHNITKKNVIEKILDGAIENNFFDLVMFQYYWNFMLPIIGKIYCSENLYMLHQDHFNMISKNSDIMNFNKSLFYNKKYFDSFFLSLAEEIKNQYNVEINEAKLELLNYFSYYQLLSLIDNGNDTGFSLKKNIINLFKQYKLSNFVLNFKKKLISDDTKLFLKNIEHIKKFIESSYYIICIYILK